MIIQRHPDGYYYGKCTRADGRVMVGEDVSRVALMMAFITFLWR